MWPRKRSPKRSLGSCRKWVAAYCKLASVTFSPSGSYKISRPKTVMDISRDMTDVAIRSNLMGKMKPWQDIDMDGLEVDAHTGTVNIYLPDDNHRKNAEEIVDAYNRSTNGEIVVRLSRVDKSKSRPGTMVARVEIVKNKTAEYGEVPEANLANENAAMVLKMLEEHGMRLGLAEDRYYAGSFSVDDYWLARNLLSEEAKAERLKDPSTTTRKLLPSEDLLAPGEPHGSQPSTPWEEIERQREMEEVGKVTVHHPGMTMERIESYLRNLDRISRWIEDQGLPDKTISYS